MGLMFASRRQAAKKAMDAHKKKAHDENHANAHKNFGKPEVKPEPKEETQEVKKDGADKSRAK